MLLNSTTLKVKPALTVSCSLQNNGLKRPVRLALLPNRADMAVERLLTKTLLLNLPRGCRPMVVLSNMESINALLIRQELPQSQRLIELNKVAITQMRSLAGSKNLKQLE